MFLRPPPHLSLQSWSLLRSYLQPYDEGTQQILWAVELTADYRILREKYSTLCDPTGWKLLFWRRFCVTGPNTFQVIALKWISVEPLLYIIIILCYLNSCFMSDWMLIWKYLVISESSKPVNIFIITASILRYEEDVSNAIFIPKLHKTTRGSLSRGKSYLESTQTRLSCR